MKEVKNNENIYKKLTPERQKLVDIVLENLKNGAGIWQPGWIISGAPISAITNKMYRGLNNVILTLVSMKRGYSDNRWATYNQIKEQDWHFKTDEEGRSLGKGAGVAIEYFELRDRQTKRRFDRHILDGMTRDEQEEYERENVYAVRKYYRVFNADLIEGIPEKETLSIDENGKNERADNLIDYWNENESKIIFGGSKANYVKSSDEIHLPNQIEFKNLSEFYSTAFHEIAHSTAHESRLGRKIDNEFGDANYALEELRAELSSMFIEQNLDILVDEGHIRNCSAYVQEWHNEISENPNVLFTAIADADKISRFIMLKEELISKKEIQVFAVKEDLNEYGGPEYKVYFIGQNGEPVLALDYSFTSREALLVELKKQQESLALSDKDFKEVSFEELCASNLTNRLTEEKSEVYIKPSVIAALKESERKSMNMSDRGVDSLKKMSDREVIENAQKSKNAEKFSALYNGLQIYGSEEKDERALMMRLAIFCNGNRERLLRVFGSSGQFNEEKPIDYYEKMAEQSMQFIELIKDRSAVHTTRRNKEFTNEKS